MTQVDAAWPVEQDSIRARLLALLLEAGAYRPESQFVNVDHLWATPSILEPFCHYLAEFLRATLPVPQVAGLISLEFGRLEITATLAKPTFVGWFRF